jgi:dihydropyrimidine dehydrogenase (NAD+) subunit PreA
VEDAGHADPERVEPLRRVDVRGTKASASTTSSSSPTARSRSNFREIYETKKKYPKHAVIVSLMVETREEWKDIIKRSIDAGADGLELNFGCPHGMCERGMGSAVGQEPKVNQRDHVVGGGVLDGAGAGEAHAQRGRHRAPWARGAARRGARGVAHQHHQEHHRRRHRSLRARAAGRRAARTNGGYCGAAVKPIAL